MSLTGLFGGVVVRAATETSATTRKLDQTPTWAVASICAVIIIISILLEKFLHKIGTVSFSVCVNVVYNVFI